MTIAFITGASSGIGTVYARRLAARGHGLVLVARAADRLNALADELRAAHEVPVDVFVADLTDPAQLERVAERLRADPPIDILVNNAGAGLAGGIANSDPVALESLLRLNALAPTMLTAAVLSGMLARGEGSIVNIASVLALLPEYSHGIYAATKSYLMTMSQSLNAKVGDKGIYVQAVLPAATRTQIYDRMGGDISKVPHVMDVEDLVDAALIGFDRRELVTIPPVPDAARWTELEQARMNLAQGFSNAEPAERYRR